MERLAGLDSFETDNAESLPLTRFSNPLVQFEVIDLIHIGSKGGSLSRLQSVSS